MVTEYRGVSDLYYAEVTADTDNAYTTGTPKRMAGVATIAKTTASSVATHYYDNAPAVVISSAGADEITLTVSAIPLDVLADITGQTWDQAKGAMIEGPAEHKEFAIGYKTKRTDGTEVYVWRLKGVFSVPDQTSNTEDDGTDAEGQELTFTGIQTVHQFTATGAGAKAVVADDGLGLAKVSDWFTAVVTPDTLTVRTP